MGKTIDERLEALTESVEILLQMQLASEKRQETMDGRMAKILTALEQDGENIRSLARIAEAHEHRLDGLEGLH